MVDTTIEKLTQIMRDNSESLSYADIQTLFMIDKLAREAEEEKRELIEMLKKSYYYTSLSMLKQEIKNIIEKATGQPVEEVIK